MTPKQVARSLVSYGKKHPELDMTAFVIPQVPGSMPRSHPVDGVAESLVESKKYLLPMIFLAPEVTGGVVVAYLVDGRYEAAQGDAHLRDWRRGNDIVANLPHRASGPGVTKQRPRPLLRRLLQIRLLHSLDILPSSDQLLHARDSFDESQVARIINLSDGAVVLVFDANTPFEPISLVARTKPSMASIKRSPSRS